MISAAIALWAGLAATTAQAAEVKPCLTDAEAQSIFLAVAPDIIKSVAQKCAPSLPADAMLKGGLTTFTAPFGTAAAAAWPTALPAISKMAGPDTKDVDPAMLKPMIGPMIGAMAADKLKPADCVTIDHAVTLLAPLPPANVAGLVVMAATSKAGGNKAPFTICPTVAPATLVPAPK